MASDSDQSELLDKLIDHLQEKNVELAARSRRGAILIALLVLLFELVTRNLVGEISFLSIKLSKLAFVTACIPPITAYMVSSLVMTSKIAEVVREAQRALIESAHPSWPTSGLHDLIAPDYSPLFPRIPTVLTNKLVRGGLQLLIELTEVLLLIIGPVCFWGYAYVRLFDLRSAADALVWCSLAATSLFALLAVFIAASKPQNN
ncbi:hypothetical protein GCM10010255_82510 [Streptomyces coeruleofuscus]|uniref:Uncharacterized protein n=1 Tax=Streptomyces coeruleofuscus TaxID=66879 RepID=A0ABN3JD94_9ACTN